MHIINLYISSSRSKSVSVLIKEFYNNTNSILDHDLLNPTYQQYVNKLFEKSEWKNSTLPDIHHQLMVRLVNACQFVNQMDLVKRISKEILQLDMRPDTWRKLQFDHISFFSNMDW